MVVVSGPIWDRLDGRPATLERFRAGDYLDHWNRPLRADYGMDSPYHSTGPNGIPGDGDDSWVASAWGNPLESWDSLLYRRRQPILACLAALLTLTYLVSRSLRPRASLRGEVLLCLALCVPLAIASLWLCDHLGFAHRNTRLLGWRGGPWLLLRVAATIALPGALLVLAFRLGRRRAWLLEGEEGPRVAEGLGGVEDLREGDLGLDLEVDPAGAGGADLGHDLGPG